jgi:hypothetical protein
MKDISIEDAIHNAITILNLRESTLGKAWKVRRLDHPGEFYYLVQLGDTNASVGVAVVDTQTGEVGIYAKLPGVGPHITVDASQAQELAADGNMAQVELVWMPCEASKSPLYPLWEVRTPRGVQYVDQQRNVRDKLEPSQLGGN